MFDLLSPLIPVAQCINNILFRILATLDLILVAPFTWEYFNQNSVCSSSLGLRSKRIAGVLMPNEGLCYGLSAFYVYHAQNHDGQSFVKSIKDKLKFPDAHKTYFEKLLLTHMTASLTEPCTMYDINELYYSENTMSSLIQKYGFGSFSNIGIALRHNGNSSGHRVAFSIIQKPDMKIQYELFDPNFGIYRTFKESALKLKILELISLYGYTKYRLEDMSNSIPNNVDWNLVKNHCHTPLTSASHLGDKSMVKFLLDQGATIDLKDGNGFTPLTTAVSEGNIGMVKLLLDKGANIDQVGGNSSTPLTTAICKGNRRMVKLLLEKGANIDLKDGSGWTPLRTAIDQNIGMIELLLEKGASTDIPEASSTTPFMHAVHGGDIEKVKLLLKKEPDINSKDNFGWTPLMSAASKGNTAIVELLLKHRVDVNLTDYRGEIPKSISTNRNYAVIVDLIKRVPIQPKKEEAAHPQCDAIKGHLYNEHGDEKRASKRPHVIPASRKRVRLDYSDNQHSSKEATICL